MKLEVPCHTFVHASCPSPVADSYRAIDLSMTLPAIARNFWLVVDARARQWKELLLIEDKVNAGGVDGLV